LKNAKNLKILFIFLTILMVSSIIFGVITEHAKDINVMDRILAGVVGSLIVVLLNYLIFKILSKIWK
jgi:hypothetical protein